MDFEITDYARRDRFLDWSRKVTTSWWRRISSPHRRMIYLAGIPAERVSQLASTYDGSNVRLHRTQHWADMHSLVLSRGAIASERRALATLCQFCNNITFANRSIRNKVWRRLADEHLSNEIDWEQLPVLVLDVCAVVRAYDNVKKLLPMARVLRRAGFSREAIKDFHNQMSVWHPINLDRMTYSINRARPFLSSAGVNSTETSMLRVLIEAPGLLSCSGCGTYSRSCVCAGGRSDFRVRHDYKFSGGNVVRNSAYVPRFTGIELEVCGFSSLGRGSAGNAITRLFGDPVKVVKNKTATDHDFYKFFEKYGGSVKGDASLPEEGRELVLSPIRKKAAINQTREIGILLAKSGAWVDNRAGGHVHVTVDNLSVTQKNNIWALWWCLQSVVFRKLAVGRRDGRYGGWMERVARPSTTSRVKWLLANNESQGTNRLFGSYTDERYVSLNRTSEENHGTYEFRLFPGTVSGQRALANMSVASKIVHFAKVSNPAAMKRALKKQGEELFAHVVGKRTYKLVNSLPRNDYSLSEPIYSEDCAGRAKMPSRQSKKKSKRRKARDSTVRIDFTRTPF